MLKNNKVFLLFTRSKIHVKNVEHRVWPFSNIYNDYNPVILLSSVKYFERLIFTVDSGHWLFPPMNDSVQTSACYCSTWVVLSIRSPLFQRWIMRALSLVLSPAPQGNLPLSLTPHRKRVPRNRRSLSNPLKTERNTENAGAS